LKIRIPLYSRLLRYVKPYRWAFGGVIVAMILSAATEPLIPALLKPLLDEGFVAKDPEIIKSLPLWLILLATIRGLSTFASQVGLTWIASRVVFDLRGEMFARLLSLPTARFDNASAGALLSKVTFDANRVMLATTEAIIVIVRDSLAVLGLLLWMFYLNWQLSLILFSIVPFIVLVVKYSGKKMRRGNLEQQDNMGQMTRILEEAISGHKLVKIFGGQDYENNRFKKASNGVRFWEVRLKTISHLSMFAAEILIALVLALIIYIATSQAGHEQVSVGEFISLFAAMGMLFSPIKRLTKVNEQIQQGLAAAQTVFELIDEIPEREFLLENSTPQKIKGNIEFRNLNFSYSNDKKILSNIDLKINAGETIGLVGISGSGKTTLTNLLACFYPIENNQIFIDQYDINEISLKTLREHLALVSQEIVLFNDTIAANIAYGSMSNASKEDIEKAAEAAFAMEFIKQMPDGLNTMIGERGVKLSGGQRQRLAIARALLKNAPILIFDEATSALDSHAEQQVQMALENLRKNRTTLIIAHRLSTIEKADRIVVLEQGRIAEIGTHQTLLESNGMYAHLYQTQVNKSMLE
jgi:ATP-binding cassette, subfamily B, bacterial MsbA